MKRAILAAVLIITASTAHAADPWTKTDTALLVTSEALILMDMSQTLQFRRRQVEEKNFLAGERPHRDRVVALIASSMILTAAVSYFAPSRFREGFLVGVIIGDGSQVYHNKTVIGCQLGYRF